MTSRRGNLRAGHILLPLLLVLGLASRPGHAVYVEGRDYLPVPEAGKPLEGLLPEKGVESAEGRGLLKVNSEYLKRRHNVNFETRQVEVLEYVAVPGAPAGGAAAPGGAGAPGIDSTALWQAYYAELATYSADMGELAWRRKWLSGLIGQEDASSSGTEGMLDIVLPVNVPDWMKRIGVDKPRLRINGSYKLVVEGSRLSGSGAPGGGDSWFPNLHMDQQPAFSVKGSIGRLINIEINSEEGFGTNLKEQLKITYKGEGDELEDDIIQEIEAGNTSLALTGTSLTGYTENHKGLFGLKMRMKFGGLEVTTIASQEGASQEKQKLGLGSTFSEFVVEDRAMRLHQHFFLRLSDREDYRNVENWKGGSPAYLSGAVGRRPVQVFRLLVGGEEPGFADTSKACAYGLDNRVTEPCEAGRWKPLAEGEFFYDERLRMLTVPGGHRNLSLAVRYQGDPVPNLPGGGRDSRSLVLIHSRTSVGVEALDSLMWRNVYNIGKVSRQDRDQFRLRVVDKDSAEKRQGDDFTYLRRLGLEHPTKPGQPNYDNQDIFNFEQGYMVLPCRGGLDEEDDRANCLTPMRRATGTTGDDIYTRNVDEVGSGSTVIRFIVTGRNRKSTFDVRETSHSVSGSQCLDITPGTERLVLNGSTVLVRNQDYEVLYETGQITLTSARARDPNADIEVSYECNPPFQIQDKVLLGTRLEYKLEGISEESILGATFLYKSQTTTAERPELGREPFNQMLWGFNARLTGSPKWMTRAANLVPFVETEAPSKALFDFEVAQSRYNPNTKSSAYLDNFEGSENVLSMPTTIYSWFQASPPAYDSLGRPDETLDYRHMGRFWWHSNIKEQYSRIYGRTSSRVTDQREQVLLKLTLEPNDNLEGNSWGGVMRGLTSGLFNQSRKRVLEVVVHGRSGRLNVDLGQISEDVSIPSIDQGRPDGRLQSEVRVGLEVVNKNDFGLDNLPKGGEVGAVRWECRPNCFASPVDSGDGDPAGDNWKEPESENTEESPRVNGTEGNNQRSGGFAFDTEDLDRSGVLDTRDLFMRYRIDLEAGCDARTHCEPLRNNWRKYQIPLYGSGVRVGATAAETEAQILSTVKMARVWLGRLPRRVSKAQVLIARLNLVGNSWEEGDRNRDFEIDQDRFTSGDLRDSLSVRVPPAVSDSNRLRVDIINKQEEKSYQPSPNTKIERDTRTDEPMPERSLVLRYENLHPGEAVHATRLLGSEPKDLTLYDRLLLEIHPDSTSARGPDHRPGQNRVSFGLRLGKDQGNRESRDYYEIRLHMDTSADVMMDPTHRSLWLRNSFDIDMDDLTSLKNDTLYLAYPGRQVTKRAWHEGRGDSSITLTVVGNPTLSRIDWMRMVVYVDSGAAQLQEGEIWINDLRLEGVDRSLGTAAHTRLQLDFSDFVTVSGNLTYRNGGFTTMSETKATPANSRSTVDYNMTAGLAANKFFPDAWGLSIPLNISYRGAIARPFTRPSSDVGLSGTDFMDMMRDLWEDRLRTADTSADERSRNSRLYQSTQFETKFSAAYKKEHRSKAWLNQILFERPEIQYSQTFNDNDDFYTTKDIRRYETKVMYSLSPFENRSYKPFEASGKWKYMPSFVSGMDVTPLWDKLNLTLWDMQYLRDHTLNKPRNAFDVPSNTPTQFQVDLAHSVDLAWRPLSFWNFDYRLETGRDFDREHGCFDDTFFSGDSTCGIFASDRVFSLDDAFGARGDKYLILDRERTRTQTFTTGFNPALASWLTLGANYDANYRHTRNDRTVDTRDTTAVLQPEHFDASADHSVRLNTSLSLPGILGTGGDGKGVLASIKKKMEDWRLRNLDGSYTVTHKYNNEQFTYEHLAEDKRLSRGSFYAYQLGLVYDGPMEFLSTLFEGEPSPRYFGHLALPDDNLNEITFSHDVSRTWDAGTGLTVPGMDLSLSLNAKYSKQYLLYRGLQASDTTVVWPDYTVTGTFGDFANRVALLRRFLRSITTTTTYNYREEDKRSLFSQVPESHRISHKLDPLLRVAATTNKDWRAEVSFKLGMDRENQFTKSSAGVREFLWYGTYRNQDTSLPIYPRNDTAKTPKDGFNVGGDASISKDVETQKGLQFWRYYIKLQNNLRLKLSSSFNYSFEESRPPKQEAIRNRDILTGTVKPEVSYNFTNNVDALFFVQYKYDKLWHTAENESTHEVQVHGEFTMRF